MDFTSRMRLAVQQIDDRRLAYAITAPALVLPAPTTERLPAQMPYRIATLNRNVFIDCPASMISALRAAMREGRVFRLI